MSVEQVLCHLINNESKDIALLFLKHLRESCKGCLRGSGLFDLTIPYPMEISIDLKSVCVPDILLEGASFP